MSMQVTCPHCASDLQLPRETAGRQAKCSRCGEAFSVPSPIQPQWAITAYRNEQPMDVLPVEEALPADDFATAFRSGTSGHCEACGRPAPTQYVVFHQHIGAVVLMFHKSVKGNLCRECISRYFSDYTLTTLFAGWWGMLSFFATPVFLLINIARYFSLSPMEDAAPRAMEADRRAAARLTGPAVGLLATSGIGVLWLLVAVLANTPRIGKEKAAEPVVAAAKKAPEDPWAFPFPVMWYVQGAVSFVVIAGAVQMMRRRTYYLAVVSAVLGSIPMLGACCIASVPFGIWGLVVLLNGEVRSAFH